MAAPLAYSESCERNKAPILAVLQGIFANARQVLEIGSGTGQHAVWFASHLSWLRWQPTELAQNLPGLQQRLDLEAPGNVPAAIALDVAARPWPVQRVDAVFSANTLHIMSWRHVQAFFRGVGDVLEAGGALCVYGPFRYRGEFTTPSNAQFDAWLKHRDPVSGVRDFEAVDELARAAGLVLEADHAMPANNQLLVWRRTGVA